MNGPGAATTTHVTYDVLWLCSTNGMNEATEGIIEIDLVEKELTSRGSLKAVGGNRGAGATHEDLIKPTTDGSAETTDTTSSPSKGSSPQDILCIAKLTWGSWEATFLGSYNPLSESYRSMRGGLSDFTSRTMNKWMEIGLKGHTITRLGIDCPQRDDHGHEMLVFHMTWEQSPLESRTARLFAKRKIGEASLGFSEGEFRELGIPKQVHNNRLLKQPDVPTASSKPDYRACHNEDTTGRDQRIGRAGYSGGARGASRGNPRGKARGRGQARPTKKPSHGMTWHTWGRVNK